MEYNDYNGITNYIGLIMLANNSCKIIIILCGVFVSEQCYKSTIAKHWNELLSHWYGIQINACMAQKFCLDQPYVL